MIETKKTTAPEASVGADVVQPSQKFNMVLEALSCEIPVIVRDIPVYEGWLTDGEQVRKASNLDSYEQAVRDVLYEEPREKVRRRIRAGRELAEEQSRQATGEKLY